MVLSACWIVFLTVLMMLISELRHIIMTGSYDAFWRGFSYTGTIEVIYLIILSIATSIFLEKHSLAMVIKERKIDRWCLEILIVVIICIVGMAWKVLPLVYQIDNMFLRLGVCLGGSLLAVLLYVAIALLIRKKVLKLTRSTSLFIREYDMYKKRTPLESKRVRRHRIYWVLVCGILILVEQIMTDMEDALNDCEFTYVKKFAEAPLSFHGDNTKMYRVVQNILENTVKYSLAHTRVFVETEATAETVRLKVKNIASYEMDFGPEEILERFARGDKARTSEGHGLGLAIASNLIDNMNGSLCVETDGDVFKVTIEMKRI